MKLQQEQNKPYWVEYVGGDFYLRFSDSMPYNDIVRVCEAFGVELEIKSYGGYIQQSAHLLTCFRVRDHI